MILVAAVVALGGLVALGVGVALGEAEAARRRAMERAYAVFRLGQLRADERTPPDHGHNQSLFAQQRDGLTGSSPRNPEFLADVKL